MDMVVYKPIGVVRSPFKEPKGTPIQPAYSEDARGTVEIYSEYSDGLKDIEGFSHIILIYHFHRSKESVLQLKPYMDDTLRGRLPARTR